jgi:hypothetical protein
MNKLLQLPAIITSVATKIDCIKFTLDTNGQPPSEHITQMINYQRQAIGGWFTFNVHQIEPENIIDLPPLPRTEKKTKSQQLRAVLYRYWEQDKQGYESSDEHYNMMMDKYINHIKDKLE